MDSAQPSATKWFTSAPLMVWVPGLLILVLFTGGALNPHAESRWEALPFIAGSAVWVVRTARWGAVLDHSGLTVRTTIRSWHFDWRDIKVAEAGKQRFGVLARSSPLLLFTLQLSNGSTWQYPYLLTRPDDESSEVYRLATAVNDELRRIRPSTGDEDLSH